MRRTSIVLAAATALVLTLHPCPAPAAETAAAAKDAAAASDRAVPPAAEDQARMEAWMKAAQPGEQHQILGQMAGTWTTSLKSFGEPSQPPQESQGTSIKKMILGGRYLQEDASGGAMGQPFQGMGLLGYDNIQKRFVSMWVDNMSTGIMTGTGSYDASAKTILSTGQYDDVVSGKKVPYRSVTRIVSPDQHVFEYFAPGPDGSEFLSMEVTYARQRIAKDSAGR